MKRIAIALAVAASLLPAAAGAQELKCQKDLFFAAGTYLQCMQKAMSAGGGSGKCVEKYVATWPKVVKKYAGQGTSCSGGRYLDNGDGTFDDRLTRLTWEKKDDSGGIHDWDNLYSWSTGDPWKETGTVFTTFLKTLNDSGFGGSRGWRLPSVSELNTLVEPGYPNCGSPPCTTVPGLTRSDSYQSSSSTSPADYALVVRFADGYVTFGGKTNDHHVRAVRSGS